MFDEVVGTSPELQAVLLSATMVAPTDSTILIAGETGTGKELIARAIHKRSRRSDKVFVSVNCAAIPASLIASELFGHEKGAFTGAVQQRRGRFELAHSGTIFLDEIGDVPTETQIALLRGLQERQIERVGATRTIPVDVPNHRRDQPRRGRRGHSRDLSSRSLLQVERISDPRAALAEA
jgi:transcriptional regulator with GAF, ATPase, and Fis domain